MKSKAVSNTNSLTGTMMANTVTSTLDMMALLVLMMMNWKMAKSPHQNSESIDENSLDNLSLKTCQRKPIIHVEFMSMPASIMHWHIKNAVIWNFTTCLEKQYGDSCTTVCFLKRPLENLKIVTTVGTLHTVETVSIRTIQSIQDFVDLQPK